MSTTWTKKTEEIFAAPPDGAAAAAGKGAAAGPYGVAATARTARGHILVRSPQLYCVGSGDLSNTSSPDRTRVRKKSPFCTNLILL